MKENELRTAPFDIYAARQGAQVVTRDGTPVAIATFDGVNYRQPIEAAVWNDKDGLWAGKFCNNGRFFSDGEESGNDLMMNVDEDGDFVFPNRPKVHCDHVVEPGYGEFNLDMAKQGAMVVTRGKKLPVRIVCFDRRWPNPILALHPTNLTMQDGAVHYEGERILFSDADGKEDSSDDDILMVLDERGNYAFPPLKHPYY